MKKVFALITLLASGSAFAIDDNEVIQKLAPAWVSLQEKAVALAGSEYHKLMVDAAFASVASSACPGITFNGDEANKRFGRLVDEKGGKTPEEQKVYAIKASTLYGAFLGLMLAESHLDTPAFCKYVDNAKAKKDSPNPFWTLK